MNSNYKIFGEKTHKRDVFVDETEENAIIIKLAKRVQELGGYTHIDAQPPAPSIYKEIEIPNKKLEIGQILRVERWDWNGIPMEVTITDFTEDGKIITSHGSVKYDPNHKDKSKLFKWKKKMKGYTLSLKDLNRAYHNVNLRDKYFEV